MKTTAIKTLYFFSALCITPYLMPAQNVGVGTTTPNANARLHVDVGASTTSGILFTGSSVGGGTVPDLGAGSRLMFYPGRAAFRAGSVEGTQWDQANVGSASTAMGRSTIASGDYATAIGLAATASGYASVSLGSNTNASGGNAVALGISSTASGNYSTATGRNTIASGSTTIAMGWNSIASGDFATAIGTGATATGYGSVSLGNNTVAAGTNSTAMGLNTDAIGSFSMAFGRNTMASGLYSTAWGNLSTASGFISTSIGYNNRAKGYASFVVGMFNDSILLSDQVSAPNSATPLFIIGNGDAHSTRSNAMVVLKNGNVGIGTNAPTANLVLNDAANATLQLQEAGVDKGFVQLSGNNLRLGAYSSNSTANVIFRLNGNDRFTIFPTGNATLTGTLTQNSDERLKQNIRSIDNALDKVLQLNGYEYEWKPELQRDNTTQIGLIAQNVEKVLPQLVATDKEGTKSVAYQNMVPVLIEAMKEQQQRIEQLEAKIKELQKNSSAAR